jgi:hypothetical protein
VGRSLSRHPRGQTCFKKLILVLRSHRDRLRSPTDVRRVGAGSLHVRRSSGESAEAGPWDQAGQTRPQAVGVGCRAPRSDSARSGGIPLLGRRAPQGVGTAALRARTKSISQAGASAHAGEPGCCTLIVGGRENPEPTTVRSSPRPPTSCGEPTARRY